MMIALLNFVLESSLSLFGFFGLYFLLFRNDNQLFFRRFYLISTVVLSLLFPLMDFSDGFFSVPAPESISVGEMAPFYMPEITIQTGSAAAVEKESNYWSVIVLGGFLLLSLAVLIRSAIQIVSIIRLKNDSRFEKKRLGNHTLVFTRGVTPTFSFMNTIFIGDENNISEEDTRQILLHEMAHVRQRHSLDNLFFEVMSAIFWYHPVIWYYKQEARAVHEYLADRGATKDCDREKYVSLLSRVALESYGLQVGAYFNASQTLKRIKMVSLNGEEKKWWKTLMSIPVIGMMFFVFSCNKEIINELEILEETVAQVEMPPDVVGHFNMLKENNPDLEFAYVEVSEDNRERIEMLRSIDQKTLAGIFPFPDRGVIGLLLSDTYDFNRAVSKLDGDNIFTIVEDPAMPEGGYKAFYAFISDYLQYPVQAREKGVEGKVFVQFIINEEGYLTNVEAVKGIGAGCDKEAVHVVAASPKWKPARQRGQAVKQRIVLPITFKLNDGLEQNENNKGSEQSFRRETKYPNKEGIYTIVEDPAMPLGGYKEFYRQVAFGLRYPKQARAAGTQGRVYVQFVVNEEGRLTEAKTVKGIGGGCDEEAVRVVSSSPKWKPPVHGGKAVKQRIVLPITFKIDGYSPAGANAFGSSMRRIDVAG